MESNNKKQNSPGKRLSENALFNQIISEKYLFDGQEEKQVKKPAQRNISPTFGGENS